MRIHQSQATSDDSRRTKRMPIRLLWAVPGLLIFSACQPSGESEKSDPTATLEAARTTQATCDQDCFSVLRASVDWLVERQSFEPSDIVLEINRSGMRYHGTSADSARLVDRGTLDRLVTVTGLTRGTREDVVACSEGQLPHDGCALTRGVVLVTLQPPVVAANDARLVVITERLTMGSWRLIGYELSLRNDAVDGWAVRDVAIVDRS